VGRTIVVLVLCPEAEDLQIDYDLTVRHIFQYFNVLTEMTTTSCANLVYTHTSNMLNNHNLLNETNLTIMLEQLVYITININMIIRKRKST